MVYNAAFKQSGVIRAEDTEEIFEFTIAFETQPQLKGNKMAIVRALPPFAVYLTPSTPRFK